MEFSVRKTTAPELDKETLSLAENISKKLSYDDDLGLVKYIDGKKIGVYFAPFSAYLALRKLGKKPISFGVIGLIRNVNRYLLTEQANKVVEIEGMGKLIDVPRKNCLSFNGFAVEWEKDPIECAYAELSEELGMEADDVREIKRELIIREDEVLLAILFTTELEEDVIMKLSSLAIDKWEIEKIEFLEKEKAMEFLSQSPHLGIFKRLVL
ncbi:MAG: NUDIX hydrolase [Candidatus Micrarchaeota archaeon]|nr:NUDIX hydrolase [Candidatus Micrarchaeota archaeon]